MPPLEQLTLWQELEVAAANPEQASIKMLWTLMESAINRVPESRRLDVAGEAILQMALILEGRSELLDSLLNAGSQVETVEEVEDFLAGLLLNRTMDHEPPLAPREKYKRILPRKKPSPTDTLVAEVSKQQVLSLREALHVAHSEDVSEWGRSIEIWFENNPGVNRISLRDLQAPLNLSVVELWLGMLLYANVFSWESADGNFYAEDVWVYYQPRR